jgi:hypothetical protein
MFKFRWRAEPDCHDHTENVMLGGWVEFVMEIKWTNSSQGYAKLWMNGLLVKEIYDIKTLMDDFQNPACNVYWAVGIYTDWAGTKQYLDLYVDNIEIIDTSGVTPVSVFDNNNSVNAGEKGVSPQLITLNMSGKTLVYRIFERKEVFGQIFSLRGRKIATFKNSHSSAGVYETEFMGNEAFGNHGPNGFYVVRIENGGNVIAKKICAASK